MRTQTTSICPNCQKKFVQNTNHPKTFCGRKCATIASNHNRSKVPETGNCAYCQKTIYKKFYRLETYCSTKCSRLAFEENKRANENINDVFWSKVDRSGGPDSCWLWTGYCPVKNAYGRFVYNKTIYNAHRFAYEITNGPIPEGMVILHSCDVRRCCNPAHLSIGTNAENSKDMVVKNRSAFGEKNPKSKLTSEQVKEIRTLHQTGNYTFVAIAKMFNCTPENISNIVKRKVWQRI